MDLLEGNIDFFLPIIHLSTNHNIANASAARFCNEKRADFNCRMQIQYLFLSGMFVKTHRSYRIEKNYLLTLSYYVENTLEVWIFEIPGMLSVIWVRVGTTHMGVVFALKFTKHGLMGMMLTRTPYNWVVN